MVHRRALFDAAGRGDLAQVTKILAGGVDVNVKDQHGRTALHYAALHGRLAVAERLIARGADVLHTDVWGASALHRAASLGHVGSTDGLLVRGADVHCADEWGNTPLHQAAKGNNDEVVLSLLQAGADPLKKNRKGETPLSLIPGNSEAAKQMLSFSCRQFVPFFSQTPTEHHHNEGRTPRPLRPHQSDAAKQMPAAQRPKPDPSSSQTANDDNNRPAPLTELQQLWLRAKSSAFTRPQLFSALKAEHITSFSDLVLAHHLLLLAARQGVLTLSQVAPFGGDRDYILENVYLPVTRLSLSVEQKLWLCGLLFYAERKGFIRDGNSTIDKIVADLASENSQTRVNIHSALVSVTREINRVQQCVSTFEQWTRQAAQSFQHLSGGQHQMLSDMTNMAASLQQLHHFLQRRQRNRIIAGVLDFCLTMIPVVGGVLAGTSVDATSIVFGFEVEHDSSGANAAVDEILAVDISNFRTVSVLTSVQYISKLNPVVRQRVEAILGQTDFKTLLNLQQRLTVVMEELKGYDDVHESVVDEIEAELNQRFAVLASRSHSGGQVVTAQDSIPELQHLLQVHLNQRAEVTVDEDNVEDVVVKHMDYHSGQLGVDAFITSFYELWKKYSGAECQPEPVELRQRFQSATRPKELLKTKLAKPMLYALFKASGLESSSSQERLSFNRTRNDWNDAEVDAMPQHRGPAQNVIDEDGFVKVGMKILFV